MNDVECQKTQEDQNQKRAVLTGVHDDATEQEVQHLLKETIFTIGMSMKQIHIKCSSKPITQAFVQFKDNDERDKFVRSDQRNILKKELRGRNLRISPAMDAEEHKTQRNTLADENEQMDK